MKNTTFDKHKLQIAFSSILLILAFGYLFKDVIVNLFNIWIDDGNYSHGFLVPIVVSYLIWLKRNELYRTPIEPFWPALVLVILSGMMLLAGQLSIHQFTQHLALFLMIFSLTLLVFGKKWLKILIVPLLFLVFMFPLPQFFRRNITGPLQLLSSYISVNFLHLLSYPIYREGNVLYLADTTLSVAEACSGLRSIVALTFSSAVIGYMAFTKKLKTFIPLLFVLPVAVLLNWVRISGTVVLADRWGTEKALKFFHDFSGLIVILVAIGIITAIIVFIQKREIKSLQPVEKHKNLTGQLRQVTATAIVVPAMVLISLTLHSELIFSFKPPLINLKKVPQQIGDYIGRDIRIDPEITEFSSVTQDRSILYTNSHEPPINLYLGYYRMDRNLSGFFHGADVCIPGSGWRILANSIIPLNSANKKHMALMYLSERGTEKELMITWVQSGQRTETDHRKMILSVFWNAAFKFRYDDATKVMVSTRLQNGESSETARKRILQFIDNFISESLFDLMRIG